MKKKFFLVLVALLFMDNFALAVEVSTDTFGSGDNQITIDFVTIADDASSANGMAIGDGKVYNDPADDYRMGRFEITNNQWNKFQNSYGLVTGSELDSEYVGGTAYDKTSRWTGANVPTNCISWYEAAQFVNYLNTSTGNQPAYKFTGTQGTSDYTYEVWTTGDKGYDASNPYRNANAFYFLPTDDEWAKAAYWNGTTLQRFATSDNLQPTKGVEANYQQKLPYSGPWDVGTGIEELNGTFEMMGNIMEWMESPYHGDYQAGANRGLRGDSYSGGGGYMNLIFLAQSDAYDEYDNLGFRVAARVPEPATICLLGLGGLMLRRRKIY